MPRAKSSLSMSKASVSRSSKRDKAYRNSRLGMLELRKELKKDAMVASGEGGGDGEVSKRSLFLWEYKITIDFFFKF